jgi:hypothetical protein
MIKHQWNIQIIGNKQYNICYEAYIGKRERKCNITCTLFLIFSARHKKLPRLFNSLTL